MPIRDLRLKIVAFESQHNRPIDGLDGLEVPRAVGPDPLLSDPGVTRAELSTGVPRLCVTVNDHLR